MTVTRHHAAQLPVRHFAYAGGYTGETTRDETYVERHHERRHLRPPAYVRPDEAYGRQAYHYDRREEGYAQDNYREERRESGHAPYVDERRDDGAWRREGAIERGGSSSSYEHHESGYSSGGGSVSGGGYADDCNCRPQAGGRDRQGFLTWPGKR